MIFKTSTRPAGQWYQRFAWLPTRVGTMNGKTLWVWLERYEQKNEEDHAPFSYRYHFVRRSPSSRHIGCQNFHEDSAKYA